jgi:hypothetical protein
LKGILQADKQKTGFLLLLLSFTFQEATKTELQWNLTIKGTKCTPGKTG